MTPTGGLHQTICKVSGGGGGIGAKPSPILVTLWTALLPSSPTAHGFPRQECWSGLSFSSPGDLSDPGIVPRSPALQVVS